jgi:hypothetical protein
MSHANFLQLAPAGTVRPEGATSMLTLEAMSLTAAPSVGSNPDTANMVLFGFSDEKFIANAEVEGVRSYDVLPGTEKVLEASQRSLSSVKAVLVINGTVKMEPPNFRAMLESEEMSKGVGQMFAQHAGLIVKHFLASRWGKKDRGGGCYFFQSTDEIEAYLSSEFWEGCVKDTPWEDVTYEMYAVAA